MLLMLLLIILLVPVMRNFLLAVILKQGRSDIQLLSISGLQPIMTLLLSFAQFLSSFFEVLLAGQAAFLAVRSLLST